MHKHASIYPPTFEMVIENIALLMDIYIFLVSKTFRNFQPFSLNYLGPKESQSTLLQYV